MDWSRLIGISASAPRNSSAASGLAAYAFAAWRHSGHFRDRIAFWQNAAASSPHLPLAHSNLGAMHYLDGRLGLAEAEFRVAAELNPAEPMVHNNLGLILARRGLLKEAEEEYRKELAVNPDYDTALFNLGLLHYRQGRHADAERLWRRTLEVNPDYAEAYSTLAVFYLGRRDRAQAARYVGEMRRKGMPVPPQLERAVGP